VRRVLEIAPKPQRVSGRVSKLILTIIKNKIKHPVYIPVLGGSQWVTWFSDWFSFMFWFWVKIGLKICIKVLTHVRTGLENWNWFFLKERAGWVFTWKFESSSQGLKTNLVHWFFLFFSHGCYWLLFVLISRGYSSLAITFFLLLLLLLSLLLLFFSHCSDSIPLMN
jgi:hypothetical protein